MPDEALASPADLPEGFGPDVPFWKPSWQDSWKYLGWRWVLFLPLLVFPVLLIIVAMDWRWVQFLSAGFVKVFTLSLGLAATAAAYAIRSAVQSRREPFCIHCGYGLLGLPDNYRCPECGRAYTFRVIDEYRRDPHWFIERCKAHRKAPASPEPFSAGTNLRKRRSRDGT